MIYTDSNKYVAKIYNEKQHAESMVKLHKFLKEHGINVPSIIESKYRKLCEVLIENTYMVVYSFIDGKHIGYTDDLVIIDESLVKNIADILYHMHTIPFNNKEFKLPELKCIDKKDALYNSFIHFDLTKDNFIINKNKTSIIDFDDAKYGPSIYDVSI